MDTTCPHCQQVHTVDLLNTNKYKLAAAGTGLIVFREMVPSRLQFLLSMRAAIVGQGLGITGGGHVECGEVADLPTHTVIETALEAYRESKEENPGFDKLFDEDTFLERIQPVAQFMVSTDDVNEVHSTNFSALRVSDSEWDQIAVLPESEERVGMLRWVDGYIPETGQVSRRYPEKAVKLHDIADDVWLSAENFFHQHELRAIAMIGYLHQKNRLW